MSLRRTAPRWRPASCASRSSRPRARACRRSSARRWRGSIRSTRRTLAACCPDPGATRPLAQIDEWERQLDEIGEPLPAVELGLRWLRANAPEPAEPRLVHGDFRLGNFIVDEDGLAAVIDWELAHLGDPAEDIGWLCIRSWRFGSDDQPVAGVGEPRRVRSRPTRQPAGEPLDRDRLRYWEVFGNVKWAVICARQAHDHLTGRAPQPRARLARPPDLRAGVGPAAS